MSLLHARTVEPRASDVAERLLPYLRAELGASDLSFSERPTRLSGGNETFIYAFQLAGAPAELSAPLILRAYREGYARPDQARWEAAVQNAVAAQGYPAPRVLLTCSTSDPLGTPFVVMERLPGTMLLQGTGELDAHGQMRFPRHQAMLRAPVLLREIPRVCAEAQVRLHELDPEPLLQAIEREGLPAKSLTIDGRLDALRRRIDEDQLDGLRPALSWLLERAPATPARLAICHGDMQPNNILMEDGAITGVVDWSQAIIADPAFDLGFTKMAFDTVPLSVPRFLGWIARPAVRLVSRRYLQAYRARLPVNLDATRYYGVFRAVVVLAFISGRRLAGTREPDVWDSPIGVKNLVSHIHAMTGVAVRLPADHRGPAGA